MASIVLSYPCHEPTKRPRPMTATRIWEIARTAREQLYGRVIVGTVDVTDLMRRCQSILVNGVLFDVVWDSACTLTDDAGRPALGLCDYDDASPEQIMISIDHNLLEGYPHVAISTAAHEIGHAVFDRPADVHERKMMTGTARDSGIASSKPPETLAPQTGAMDWAEFRANEFMGGFLVPPRLLHKRLLAYSSDARLPLVERTDHHGVLGLPVVRRASSAVSELLAEDFGVGPQFIEVRLAKYHLIANQQS
ncbi:MAG: ImmA/IrrE family metallo-endopeptidase [Alphaproteobacteria bacterium]|nr:ImmA/IrrE family metallo-endopeptidase [Alphaproteobacteria bacterium]